MGHLFLQKLFVSTLLLGMVSVLLTMVPPALGRAPCVLMEVPPKLLQSSVWDTRNTNQGKGAAALSAGKAA